MRMQIIEYKPHTFFSRMKYRRMTRKMVDNVEFSSIPKDYTWHIAIAMSIIIIIITILLVRKWTM